MDIQKLLQGMGIQGDEKMMLQAKNYLSMLDELSEKDPEVATS